MSEIMHRPSVGLAFALVAVSLLFAATPCIADPVPPPPGGDSPPGAPSWWMNANGDPLVAGHWKIDWSTPQPTVNMVYAWYEGYPDPTPDPPGELGLGAGAWSELAEGQLGIYEPTGEQRPWWRVDYDATQGGGMGTLVFSIGNEVWDEKDLYAWWNGGSPGWDEISLQASYTDAGPADVGVPYTGAGDNGADAHWVYARFTQPDWEQLRFPNTSMSMTDVYIGTKCTPELSSASLLLLGVAAVVGLRKRKRS